MNQWKPVCIYLVLVLAAGIALINLLQLGSSWSHRHDGTTLASSPSLELRSSQSPHRARLLQGVETNLGLPLSQLFAQLLVVIGASRLMGHAFTRIGLPAVVGEMSSGVLLGPSLLGLLAPQAFRFLFPVSSIGALTLLSQIGICFFMFCVGMELNLTSVRRNARTAVALSHISIIVPFLLGAALACYLFGGLAGPRATFASFALFMGISMSITAFPVLARILQERGLTQTRLGSTALACAAVEDVTAWSLLAFVVATSRSTGLAGATLSLGLALIFVASMILGVRHALPHWLGYDGLTAEEPSSRTLTLVVLVVIAAAFVTEVIGIHAMFGAFVAGAVMPNVGAFRRQIGARVEKFSSALLLPLFFAFTGLRTQISLLADLHGWLLCLLIIAVATLGKLGSAAAAARVTGMSWRESLQLGALMNTRGLMELIALNIGHDLGILSPRIFTMLVLMALVTTFMTGPLLTWFGRQRDLPSVAHGYQGAHTSSADQGVAVR